MAKKDRSSNNKNLQTDYNPDYTSYLNQEGTFNNTDSPPAEEFVDPFSSTSALTSEDPLSLIPPPSSSFGNDSFGSSSSFGNDSFGSSSSFGNDSFGSSSSFGSNSSSSFGSSDFNSFASSEPIVPAYDPAKEAELEATRRAEENAQAQLEATRIAEENAQREMQLEAIRLQEEQDLIERNQFEAAKAAKEAEAAELEKEAAAKAVIESKNNSEDLDSMSIQELKDNINRLKANPGNTIDEKLLVFDEIGKYSTLLLKKLRAEKK
jgi:hypothetical protein